MKQIKAARLEKIETLRHLSRKLVRELGMLQLNQLNPQETPERWHALVEISKQPGITSSKLGVLLLMSSSKISRLVGTLGKEGFIKSYPTPGDKREKSLHLSANGHLEVKKIDSFSHEKIEGALDLLGPHDLSEIILSLEKYTTALEKNRTAKEQIKISTLSTSRPLRKKIVQMITTIQREEFFLPVTETLNHCVLKAEQEFYYNNSYNFWYVVDAKGTLVGSIGLKKIDETAGEIKKFFVIPSYRGKGVAQKLMHVLLKAASKHNFDFVYLGTVDKLEAAHRFYKKSGFIPIPESSLPEHFEKCSLDSLFFKGLVKELKRDLQNLPR